MPTPETPSEWLLNRFDTLLPLRGQYVRHTPQLMETTWSRPMLSLHEDCPDQPSTSHYRWKPGTSHIYDEEPACSAI